MNNNIELIVGVVNEDVLAVNVNISVAVGAVNSSGRSDNAADGAVETACSNDVTISNVEASERFGGREGKRLSRMIGSVDVKRVGLIGIKKDNAVVKILNAGNFVFIGDEGKEAVVGVGSVEGLVGIVSAGEEESARIHGVDGGSRAPSSDGDICRVLEGVAPL